MKQNRIMQFLAILFLAHTGQLFSQDCELHYLDGDCRSDLRKDYEIYSQSHSYKISALDTIEMNVVFYGQKDYILSFCTHRKLYPIHFILIDSQTEQVLYDNKDDKYIESLGLGFDVARPITIRVDVLARLSIEKEILEKIGCLGVMIQYKNYSRKKVELQL